MHFFVPNEMIDTAVFFHAHIALMWSDTLVDNSYMMAKTGVSCKFLATHWTGWTNFSIRADVLRSPFQVARSALKLLRRSARALAALQADLPSNDLFSTPRFGRDWCFLMRAADKWTGRRALPSSPLSAIFYLLSQRWHSYGRISLWITFMWRRRWESLVNVLSHSEQIILFEQS